MNTSDDIVGMNSFTVPDGIGSDEMYLNAYYIGTEANAEPVLPAPLHAIPECSGNDDKAIDVLDGLNEP